MELHLDPWPRRKDSLEGENYRRKEKEKKGRFETASTSPRFSRSRGGKKRKKRKREENFVNSTRVSANGLGSTFSRPRFQMVSGQSRSRYRAFSFLDLRIISIFPSYELIFQRFLDTPFPFPCTHLSSKEHPSPSIPVKIGLPKREKMRKRYLIYTRGSRERERYFKSGIKLLKYERILITAGRNYLVSCRESENGTKKRPLMIKDKYDGVGEER